MSNLISMHGSNRTSDMTTGNRYSQHKSMSWSYLSLGRVALNHTNAKQNRHVFRPSTILCIFIYEWFSSILGIFVPPKNKIAVILLNNTILLYSARKKNTNTVLLCSVKKPATNSDSASWRSNGVRLVSAKILTK